MHVKCIANKGDVLPTALRTKETSLQETSEFSLVISKNYLVYAMVFIDGYIWYCICDEHYTEYPTWKPSPLFEVIDGRMSKYWVYACDKESYEAIWAYPEWANAPHYFHFLNDSEKDYVGHFKHYKKLVDEEFPYLSVEKKADAPWLICPLCIDIYAWELNSPDAMITCSNCKRVFHNPRYKQIDASQN